MKIKLNFNLFNDLKETVERLKRLEFSINEKCKDDEAFDECYHKVALLLVEMQQVVKNIDEGTFEPVYEEGIKNES